MSDIYFKPIDKDFHNVTYKGNGEDVKDLKVLKTDDAVYSNWKISFFERFKILLSGEITVCVLSHQLPPMSIMSGDYLSDQGLM